MMPAHRKLGSAVVWIGLLAFWLVLSWQCAFAASTDPEVIFTSPTMGATVSGSNVLVQISYKSRTNLPVEHLEVYVDGAIQLGQDLSQPKLEGTAAFYWNTVGLANAMHALSAKVYDGANNLGVATLQVYVANSAADMLAPSVALYEPAPNSIVSGKVNIGVEASDDTGIKYVLVYVNDKLEFLKNYKPYTHVWDTSKLANGEYVLVAEAYDTSENKTTSPEVRVIVNNPGGETVMPVASAITPGAAAASGIDYALAPSMSAGLGPQPGALTPAPVELTLPTVETSPSAVSATSTASAQPAAPTLEIPDVVIAAVAKPTAVPLSSEPSFEGVPSAPQLAPSSIEVVTKTMSGSDQEAVSAAKQQGAAAAVVTPTSQTVTADNADGVISSTASTSSTGEVLVAVRPSVETKPASAITRPVTKPAGGATVALQHKTGAQPVAADLARTHHVQRGETLYGISTRYGYSVSEVARLNHLSPNTKLKAGANLVIPPARHKVFFKGDAISFDVDPVVTDPGISLAPFRQIFEHYGGVLFWFPDEKRVQAVAEDKQIELTIGSRKATVNDQELLLQVAAFIKEGRTMVPLRFVGEALDVTVQFDAESGNVYLKANQ